MPINPGDLTDEERQSPLWKKVQVVLEERLQTLREKNDKPSTPEDTADTRGRIAEVKRMLGLGEERPQFTKKIRQPSAPAR